MKEIIHLIVVNILSILSLAIVHEYGHLFFANLSNCKGKIIFFDENNINPYTIVECRKNISDNLILFGGLIFTFLFSFLFLVFGREFFISSLSFSLILALNDISTLINPIPILIISLFLYSYSSFMYFSMKLNKNYGKNYSSS